MIRHEYFKFWIKKVIKSITHSTKNRKIMKGKAEWFYKGKTEMNDALKRQK